jgi:RNA polymerase sigma factor (sigma-70 family)
MHPDSPDASALEFASQRLGAASRAYFATAEAQERYAALVREGRTLEDAVLGTIYREICRDRQLANEFFTHLLGDLSATGHSLFDGRLRQLMDTGELVDSVIQDLWSDLERIEFRTRGQFLSLLLRRMQWKKSDRLRSAEREKRGGQVVRAQDGALGELADAGARSPLSEAEQVVELGRVTKLLARLPQPDRELLLLKLEGLTYEEIARRIGQSAKVVRRRLFDLLESAEGGAPQA